MGNKDFLAPLLTRLGRVTGPDQQGWYTTICPFHDDHNPSLRVSARGFQCMACGEKGNLQKLSQKLGLASPSKGSNRSQHDAPGITLAQLAQARGLPLERLKELGWHDVEHRGKPAVAIPYRDIAGNLLREQLRLRLEKLGKREARFMWAPGHGVWPLGLDRLHTAREAGYILLVEGATDYAACTLAGIPVLGVPGANTWHENWVAYLQDIPRVYVWQESDAGGAALVKAVAGSTSDLLVVSASTEAKDPCALRQLGPEGFPQRMAALMAGAASFRPSRTELESDRPHCLLAGRPLIQVNGRFMREITGDALAALQQANDPLRFFQRGSELVMLAAEGSAVDALTTASLKGQLDRSADFMTIKFDKDGAEESRSPARPPDDVVKDILALKQFPFPVLNRFASTPVFLPNGTLLASQGYHAASGIYLQLDGLKHLRWDMPLEEAKGLLLDELLVDFPFADDASCAHAVAALLLPYVRPLIVGPTPLHLIDAPARGTGKGLLVDVISIVTTGEIPYVMALPKDEDELEKRITATLLAGRSFLLLDNVTALRSTNLSAVLTTTRWRGRLLGKSQMVDVPNTATWLATGNNVVLSDEMNRRTVVTRLDAGVEAPEERTGFRHRLPQWATEHRSELVSACLSIINIWIQAGMPRGEATLGRFEEWAEVMDGICGVSGVYGLLGNRDLQKSKDPESQEWTALCAAWYSTHDSKSVGAREVLAIARSASVLLELWVRRTDLAALQRVGHALSARRDRVFGGYQLRYAGTNSRSGSAEYFLHRQKMTPDKNPRNPANPATQAPDKVGSMPGFGPETPQNPAGVSDVNCQVSGVSGVLQPPEFPDVLELD